MASISVSSITGMGQPDIYTGLKAEGTATAGATIQVYYEIPSNGVMSSNMDTTVKSDGSWAVEFNGEFSAGTTVTVIATFSGGKASQTETLPTAQSQAEA